MLRFVHFYALAVLFMLAACEEDPLGRTVTTSHKGPLLLVTVTISGDTTLPAPSSVLGSFPIELPLCPEFLADENEVTLLQSSYQKWLQGDPSMGMVYLRYGPELSLSSGGANGRAQYVPDSSELAVFRAYNRFAPMYRIFREEGNFFYSSSRGSGIIYSGTSVSANYRLRTLPTGKSVNVWEVHTFQLIEEPTLTLSQEPPC
ncbi:MAG: hypothetical protein AAGB22_01290 [Bacteroidota bacterium]